MNITIYIRRDLEDLFKAEKEKSKLVNRLLDAHYSSGLKLRDKPLWPELTITEKPIKTPRITDADINRISKEMDKAESPDHIYPVIKTPKDAEKAVLATVKYDLKLCKIHKTPLDDRGRCLVKGCKYS